MNGKALNLSQFIKKFLWLCVGSIIATLLVTIVDLMMAGYIRSLTESALQADREAMFQIAVPMLLMFVIGLSCKYGGRRMAAIFAAGVIRNVRERAAHRLIGVQALYAERCSKGDTAARWGADTAKVQRFLEIDALQMVYHSITFGGAVIFMSILQWRLLVCVIAAFVLVAWVTQIITKPVRQLSASMQSELGRVQGIAVEALGSMETVKAFRLENQLAEKYAHHLEEAYGSSIRMERRRSVLSAVQVIVQSIPFLVTVSYGGYLTVSGRMLPGDLLSFLYLLNFLAQPAETLPKLIFNAKETRGAWGRIAEIWTWPQESVSSGEVTEVARIDVTDRRHAAIEFAAVSFEYEEQVILNHLDLQVKAGKIIGIVGPSGSGKSTLLKLACGLYSANSGNVRFHGKDMAQLSPNLVREQFAWIGQQALLFPGTVAENIALGRSGCSLEEVIDAARMAQAHEFIENLPDGYQTVVGEHGGGLSGGQRQRISIARAILKNAPIWLLDEPTSALDAKSEEEVRFALEQALQGKTALWVAHRLSTLQHAHEIIVMEQGKVTAHGSHEQIILEHDWYRAMHLGQAVNVDSVLVAGEGR